jgi:hypothetical protein
MAVGAATAEATVSNSLRRRPTVREEPHVNRSADLLATTVAGAIGAALAALAVGASLLFVLPVTLGVAAVAMLSRRGAN